MTPSFPNSAPIFGGGLPSGGLSRREFLRSNLDRPVPILPDGDAVAELLA